MKVYKLPLLVSWSETDITNIKSQNKIPKEKETEDINVLVIILKPVKRYRFEFQPLLWEPLARCMDRTSQAALACFIHIKQKLETGH